MNNKSLPILGQQPSIPPTGTPLFRLAFRPFYLLASLGFVVLIPAWLILFIGYVSVGPSIPGNLWHAHEMLFGVVSAVVIGFLFTAGKTWTGLPTPRGAQLVFLCVLWLMARVTAWTGPDYWFSWFDLAFIPFCLTIFVHLLTEANNRRNYIVAAVLGAIALANTLFHLAWWKVIDIDPSSTIRAGICGLVLMETLIAGRVIPFFARSVNPGLQNNVPQWREQLLAGVTVLALITWLSGRTGVFACGTCLAAAVLHGWRLVTWSPRATRGRPILWSLYLAYAWMSIAFALLAWALATGASDTAATHAITVGATSGLLIAMMTRTARGHTGRPLQVGRVETLAYVLVAIAAALRVTAPLIGGAYYLPAIVISGAALSTAFLLYFVIYAPWLTTTRADGKDG